MNYPKDFQMAWDIKPCRLNGDSIEEIKGLPESIYNPFDHYRNGEKELYLQFVAINGGDPQSILKFIETYGFLGFKYDTERMHQEDMRSIGALSEQVIETLNEFASVIIKAANDPSRIPEKDLKNLTALKDLSSKIIKETAIDPSRIPAVMTAFKWRHESDDTADAMIEEVHSMVQGQPPESEKLEDIELEILIMRALVSLWQALRTNDREEVLYQLESLNLVDQDNPSQDIMSAFKDLENAVLWYKAGGVLSKWVNRRLYGVSPLLGDMLYGNNAFTGLWYSPHLLSAMYVMFYLDLTQGVTLRKCQNKTCKEFFSAYGGDERKIYCGDRCAKAHAQREYRRRKKDQELE